MPDNRYGCAKIKTLKALSDRGALSLRQLCITTGIEYRVMAVSVLKWLKQGMVIRGKIYNERTEIHEIAYKLTSEGRSWLSSHKERYTGYLAELESWRNSINVPIIYIWLSMSFTEFRLHFSGFAGVSR